MDIAESPKVAQKYYCELCDYKCSKPSDWTKHVLRLKHQNLQNGNVQEIVQIADLSNFKCNICLKSYKTNSGLWKHKKLCKEQQIVLNTQKKEEDITTTDAKLVFELLKQNNEFIELMLTQTNQMMTQIMELAKNTNSNTTNNINNGQIQNTQFNLQLYLNETCKNAMTIDEFLDYLQPTIEELEDTARLGYVEGITRIIMRGLKDLEEELRPFHCSDLKRESLFVKNPDGEWEKETDEKPLMLRFVKAVARKNFNNVNEWRKLHPNCRFHDSKSNDMFNQIMLNSTSGRTEEEQMASYKKIIKNIVKESVIDKSKKNK